MAWMGSMEGSCTGGTKRLGTFDKPPIIIFEWDDLTYTWFYRPHPTRHLAESLVGAGVPVVIVQRPQHGGEKGDLRELEQVQFGIWCCSPWYPELEVVHDQLQGVEQRFPESPWVFRHRVCGQNPGPKRRMSVYSREERMKAVKLYFQYDRQVAPVLRELGYPSRGALRRWVAEFEATGDVHAGYRRERHPS